MDDADRANGYTSKAGSHEAEVVQLLAWLRGQPGGRLFIAAPNRPLIGELPTVARLVKQGVPSSTRKGYGGSGGDDRVLLLWPDAGFLAKVDDCGGAALGVLTWEPEPVQAWRLGRGAVDVLGIEVAASPVFDSRVDEQLGRIPFKEVLNPSDFNIALDAVQTLHRDGVEVSPDEVTTWLLAHGWQARHAADVREMYERVVAGSPPRRKRQ